MTRFERQNYERRADDIEATMRLEWLTRHRVMSEVLRELRDSTHGGGARPRLTGPLRRLRRMLGGSTSLDRAGEIAATGSQEGKVRARGYWEQVWRRFRRDRVAVASIVFLVLLVIVVYPGAWIAQKLVGHGPNTIFPDALDDGLLPVGPWSH